MLKQTKKIAGFLHLWLGLVSGLLVFIISITGCLYVFEEEIRDFTNQEYRYVPMQKSVFVGLEKVVEEFHRVAPKEKLNGIKVNIVEPNGSIEVSTKKKLVYYFNPYTAKLIKKNHPDWLNIVLEIHTSLYLGEFGEFVQGWSVVLFLITLVTGLVIWYPNRRAQFKQSVTIKWNASFKRINFDIHRALGFYASFILILVAFSGTYFAFEGVKKTVAFITGSKLNPGDKAQQDFIAEQRNGAKAYALIFNRVNQEHPGANSASFSVRKNGELRLRMLYPNTWARRQNTFFFDARTFKLLRQKFYVNNTAADTYEASNYDLHTGRFFGYPGKILWFFASLIGAVLPLTGFIIWFKKRKKKQERHS
ncbi:PepSY-associated TM helix domain-containing protein [Pedobacter sp. MW01-1-1]|uniref:PepSY-associated TM helix domain-containing protein n=1 Tax=Pedobacter sp. MW01-1-1 TaxID=3383027 RepID=UPI003FF149E5